VDNVQRKLATILKLVEFDEKIKHTEIALEVSVLCSCKTR
jgi:hypothetical protein